MLKLSNLLKAFYCATKNSSQIKKIRLRSKVHFVSISSNDVICGCRKHKLVSNMIFIAADNLSENEKKSFLPSCEFHRHFCVLRKNKKHFSFRFCFLRSRLAYKAKQKSLGNWDKCFVPWININNFIALKLEFCFFLSN